MYNGEREWWIVPRIASTERRKCAWCSRPRKGIRVTARNDSKRPVRFSPDPGRASLGETYETPPAHAQYGTSLLFVEILGSYTHLVMPHATLLRDEKMNRSATHTKPGQMSLDSGGLYSLEQNRLFLTGFKLRYGWER